jgi:cytoskeletal protein RodZ
MKKEKGIDDIFKHSLKDPVETEFRESDWDAFESMLDKDKPAGKVFWLPWISAAAAVILVFLGVWMFKPQATNTQQTQQMTGNKPAKTGGEPTTVTQPVQQPQVAATTDPAKVNDVISKPANTVKDEQTTTQQNKVAQHYTANNVTTVKRDKGGSSISSGVKHGGKNDMIARVNADTIRPYNNTTLAAVSLMLGITPVDYTGGEVLAANDVSTQPAIRPLDASKVEVKKTSTSSFHPLFAITALASSEINGVGSFNSASKGTNIGLMFTAGVKKLSISTGVNYSVKPYTLPFSAYTTTYKFKSQPEYVTADCRVLDIPINIGYQVYNKAKNKITLGTGISSYIMMHESYTYDYGDQAKVYGPSYYAVAGKGKYLWSIMNLQATYERKINSNVGLSLQPYLKLPLSSIGYSQVRVQTFGVAVGLNWNINSLTKPK